MSYQHQILATGPWSQMTFIEQMANIGSEVERALNWRERNNAAYSQKAFERSLELLDLTMDSVGSFARAKELARVREILVDFFLGENLCQSTAASWRKYFYHFNFAARRNR